MREKSEKQLRKLISICYFSYIVKYFIQEKSDADEKHTGKFACPTFTGCYCRYSGSLYANEALMQVILTIKNLLGSLIIFCVPLIIIGFISPSITRLGQHASTMLRVAITLAYVSSVGAAFFAMFSGYGIIPHLNIVSSVDGLKELPKLLFDLKIDPIMSVMSALVFSVLIGVAAAWTKAAVITKFLEEFQKIVLAIDY